MALHIRDGQGQRLIVEHDRDGNPALTVGEERIRLDKDTAFHVATYLLSERELIERLNARRQAGIDDPNSVKVWRLMQPPR